MEHFRMIATHARWHSLPVDMPGFSLHIDGLQRVLADSVARKRVATVPVELLQLEDSDTEGCEGMAIDQREPAEPEMRVFFFRVVNPKPAKMKSFRKPQATNADFLQNDVAISVHEVLSPGANPMLRASPSIRGD